MQKKSISVLITLTMFFFFSAHAEERKGAEGSGQSPVWKVKVGAHERMRYEYAKNISDLNNAIKDNKSYFRFKTSVSWDADYKNYAGLFLKLTNENRAYTYWGGASASAGKSASKKGYHYDINEVVFDNLYIYLKDIAGAPVDLRVGRQDFMGHYGENFLLADGTPLDGSRTYYFNAAKLTWRVDDKNTVDLIAIKDGKTDQLLPVINPTKGQQQLNSTDEYAFSLYQKTDSIKNLRWENYYIYKHEVGTATGAKMTTQPTGLNTIGTYARYKLEPWTLRGQIAGQFGYFGDNNRRGLGGFGFIDRDFKDIAWTPALSAGFVYLSGDNRKTPTNEMWDPLFSRFPWYSELYVLYWGSETEPYYWTNLQIYRAQLMLNPVKKMKLTLNYNFLRANDTVAPTANLFSGEHRNRGHLPQAKLEYSFNENVNAYILGEYLIPGDFYVKTADSAIFLRAEMSVRY